MSDMPILDSVRGLSPVTRHEVLGELQPHLMRLWEACDTEQFHCCLGDIAGEALDQLNAEAARIVTDYTTPRP